ncbi:MAG: aminodeoxychorismate synthase component I [Woeseiaceae bacterium]
MSLFSTVVTRPFDLVDLHQADPARFPFLLKSVATSDESEAHDILFALPSGALELWYRAGEWRLETRGDVPASTGSDDFLTALDRWVVAEGVVSDSSSTPADIFGGGWFLYLSYELAQQIEPTLVLPIPEDVPVAVATRTPAALIQTTGSHAETRIVAESAALMDILSQQLANASLKREAQSFEVDEIREEPPELFLDAVDQAKRAIGEGAVYQANLSRAWQAALSTSNATDVFKALCRSNPAPFAALAQFDDMAIISSSPERLVNVVGSKVSSRPIAGTRRRDVDLAKDRMLVEELLSHPKEQAEHVMLVDLERNDLGRICEAGSVEVDEYMTLETYAHVHHIVSNIVGDLKQGITVGDIIRAVFPGGTITGCPKIRCMQLIADLERRPRSAYTGSLGYLDLNGNLDLNILIRTFEMKENQVAFLAGAGIVADSVREAELAETRSKARGLIRALEVSLDARD